MSTIIIPVVVSAPHSIGPAIFQLVGILAVFILAIWLNRDPKPESRRDAERDEAELRAMVRAEALESIAKRANRIENRGIDIDLDSAVLVAAGVWLAIGLIGAFIWGAA